MRRWWILGLFIVTGALWMMPLFAKKTPEEERREFERFVEGLMRQAEIRATTEQMY